MSDLSFAIARLREGTEILRTGGGIHLTAHQCSVLLDELAGQPKNETITRFVLEDFSELTPVEQDLLRDSTEQRQSLEDYFLNALAGWSEAAQEAVEAWREQ